MKEKYACTSPYLNIFSILIKLIYSCLSIHVILIKSIHWLTKGNIITVVLFGWLERYFGKVLIEVDICRPAAVGWIYNWYCCTSAHPLPTDGFFFFTSPLDIGCWHFSNREEKMYLSWILTQPNTRVSQILFPNPYYMINATPGKYILCHVLLLLICPCAQGCICQICSKLWLVKIQKMSHEFKIVQHNGNASFISICRMHLYVECRM